MKASGTIPSLEWPKLIRGTLIQRYKRFMADVKLGNNRTVTAHCPNSGSMATCCEPGRPVYLSRAANPNRRLKYTWEIIEMESSLVGVNTSVPNRLVEKSVIDGAIESLRQYVNVRREVPYGRNSRIDLLLEASDGRRCYLEVKNCTLVRDGIASFPDAVTSRGLKHLVELREMVESGSRSVMFFLVQRMDALLFKPADHVDPAYGKELRTAVQDGVEIMVYDTVIDEHRIALRRPIPCVL